VNNQHLLTVNTGSSSLKTTLYRVGTGETRLLVAQAERIG
jgi:acetate kinase